MTAISSTAAGNWATGATWTGGVAPIYGDPVTVTHAVVVPVSTTAVCGTSPASGGTTALTVSGAGSISIYGTLTVRGPIRQNNAPIYVQAGGVLEYDASQATTPASQHYDHQISTANAQTLAVLYLNGTSTNAKATIRSVNGGGNGYITDGGYTQGGKVVGTYFDLQGLGTSSLKSITTNPIAGTTSTLAHGRFYQCGRYELSGNIGNTAVWSMDDVTFEGTLSTECAQILSNGSISTGTRLINGCVFDKIVNIYPPQDMTITGNFFNGAYSITDAAWAAFSGNFIRCTANDTPLAASSLNNYWFWDNVSATNRHWVQAGTYARDYTIDGDIFDGNSNDDAGDCVVWGAPGSAVVITMTRLLGLPNKNGTSRTGTILSALGSADTGGSIKHCTFFAASEPGISVGETYTGHAGMMTAVKDNICVNLTGAGTGFFMADTGVNDAVTGLITAPNLNYNSFYNGPAGTSTNGVNNLEFASGTPGANNINVDPQFVDSARNLSKWDSSLGGPGTDANALAQLKAKTTGYTISALRTYVLAGFAPQNQALKNTGSDGTDIGAVAVQVAEAPDPGDPIPPTSTLTGLAQYIAMGIEFGGYLSTYLAAHPSEEAGQSATYYDGMHVFQNLMTYTGDTSTWTTAFNRAKQCYLTFYLNNITSPAIGAASGFWNFSHGLADDYLIRANSGSRTGLDNLSTNGAFMARNGYNNTNLPAMEFSRESAHCLNAVVNRLRCGLTANSVNTHYAASEYVTYSRGHLDSWFVSKTAAYVRAFMAGITLRALIYHDTYYGTTISTATLVTDIETACEYLWLNEWLPASQAFRYTNKIVAEATDMNPAPDLNMLIVGAYGWLWYHTGDPKWITRGDQIFNGGVSYYSGAAQSSGADLGGRNSTSVSGKRFNQNYLWGFDYITYRGLTPLTAPVEDIPDVPPDPIPTTDPVVQTVARLPHGTLQFKEDGAILIIAENNRDITIGTSGTGSIRLMVNGSVVSTINSSGAQTNDFVIVDGDLVAGTVGNGLVIKGGVNSRIGAVALVGGTIAVANTSVTALTRVFLTRATPGGTLGDLSYAKVPGSGFTITSTSTSETSTINWQLVEEL